MVLQKKGVSWFRWTDARDKRYRRARTLWFFGFTLNNLLALFYYFALKSLSPAVVGAMMGLNIVFSALFSALLLGETLAKRTVGGSLVLIACITVANLAAPGSDEGGIPSPAVIALFFAAPYALAAAAHAGRKILRLGGEYYALAFAAAAGALEGFVIVLIRALRIRHGDDIAAYFLSPYLYMYLAASVSVIVFLQIAYSHGRISKTSPVLWSSQIIYPVAISYVAFSVPLVPAQLAAFAGILASVAVIQSKRYRS